VERRALLILDFDGVICDSLPECFVSSWYGYYELGTGRTPDATPRDAFVRFCAMRPYIRSGEDYLLIQALIASGEGVAEQSEFDRHLAQAGGQTMRRYKDLLYQARDRLLAEDPEYWYRLNRIYAHMRDGLRALGASAEVYILSTKRASFISRILEAAGIPFAPPNVLYSGSRPKVEMIHELMESTGAREAIFVDDQVDHFSGSRSWPRERGHVDCRLATWGYVRAEWIVESEDYRAVTPEQARELLDRFRGAPG
jgi:phosphoglycolate phosphatase-like HAD superfamily hydrolase